MKGEALAWRLIDSNEFVAAKDLNDELVLQSAFADMLVVNVRENLAVSNRRFAHDYDAEAVDTRV